MKKGVTAVGRALPAFFMGFGEMKKTFLLALTAIAAATVATSSARADVIETVSTWDVGNFWQPFGEPNTATYGQSFIAPSDNHLDSVTFYLTPYQGGPVDFKFYVMAWTGSQATGAVLAESNVQTFDNTTEGYTAFTFNADVDLISGSSYVAFINAIFDGNDGLAGVAGYSVSDYADGAFVYYNNGNDFGALTTNSWDCTTCNDLAFRMEFSAGGQGDGVPAPASLALLGFGLLGLGARARSKSK